MTVLAALRAWRPARAGGTAAACLCCSLLTDRFIFIVQLSSCKDAPFNNDVRVQLQDSLVEVGDGAVAPEVQADGSLHRRTEQLHVHQHREAKRGATSGQRRTMGSVRGWVGEELCSRETRMQQGSGGVRHAAGDGHTALNAITRYECAARSTATEQ